MKWIALKDWVGGLAAELRAAAPANQGWRGGKLSVRVRVVRLPSQEGWFVAEPGGEGETVSESGGHWVTVELAWGEGCEGVVPVSPTAPFLGQPISSGAGSSSAASGSSAEPSPLSSSDVERRRWLRERLAEVFGEPGFDSSSRATVFRECTEGLGHQELLRILDRLRADGVLIQEEGLRSAQHRLNGILRTGPLKSRSKGAEKLGEIMRVVHLTEVQRVLGEEWKTQDDWLG